MKSLYKRFLHKKILRSLEGAPAVFLNGPRQSGKSTLAYQLATEHLEAEYKTLDNANTRMMAKRDPHGFLDACEGPVVIDEIQRVPELFLPLKEKIDRERLKNSQIKGQFLLTGSTNVLALPQLSDALVGRVRIHSLYPLSAAEIVGKENDFLSKAFNNDFKGKRLKAKGSLSEMMMRATFPELSVLAKDLKEGWCNGYVDTIVQRDIRALAEIEKAEALPVMLSVFASRAGSLLNDASFAREVGLNGVTFRRYRALFQGLFLIDTVSSWHVNREKRVMKSPKVYLNDAYLLAYLLGMDLETLPQEDPKRFGHVLENFIASELRKLLSLEEDGNLYYYRTYDDKEIDFIIEKRNGDFLGVEVKSSKTLSEFDFKTLENMRSTYPKKFKSGVIFYAGDEVLPFGDRLWAVPVQYLWGD